MPNDLLADYKLSVLTSRSLKRQEMSLEKRLYGPSAPPYSVMEEWMTVKQRANTIELATASLFHSLSPGDRAKALSWFRDLRKQEMQKHATGG